MAQPPYRRKSNTGMIVTISLVSVLAITGALIAVLATTSKKSTTTSVADSGYTNYTPPSSTAPTRQDPFPTSASTPTSNRSTPTATRSSTPTRTTTSTPRGPQPVNKTKDNPLFLGQNGTNTHTCNLPKWKSDPQSAANFFNTALPCLEAAWAPVMQRANLPYVRPKIVFPTGSVWSSGCGDVRADENVAAFYCPPDVALYMPFKGLYTERVGNKPGSYLAVFAHEFGHHIQAISGSLRAADQVTYEAGPDSAAGLEMSRRVELQADCLAGMWLAAAWNGKGSINDQIVREALADMYTRGDDNTPSQPRDHGTKQHSGQWHEHGYKTNRTFECNTYLAEPKTVS
jgi:predicted metalloprotease